MLPVSQTGPDSALCVGDRPSSEGAAEREAGSDLQATGQATLGQGQGQGQAGLRPSGYLVWRALWCGVCWEPPSALRQGLWSSGSLELISKGHWEIF